MLDCWAGDCLLDFRGRTNTHGFEITQKWRYSLALQAARPSRGLEDHVKWRSNLQLRRKNRALSTQLKTEISVGTSDGTDHFGLIRPEYSRPALKVVHFDWSGYLGRSDRNVPFHLAKLFFPVPLFCILLTRTITKYSWLGSGLCKRNVQLHWARGISEISNRNFCSMESAHSVPKIQLSC